MCITARWFWTLYCFHCIQWICSAQLAQYNNRMTAVRNKNNSTNVMAINIYCYYSLNAIWQAVEWTVFFFSLLRRTMHKLICIYEMREATSNSNEMKIKSLAQLNANDVRDIKERERKTSLIEWPDVSFKIHLNCPIVLTHQFCAWISPIWIRKHQIIASNVQKWVRKLCRMCYAIAKCNFNRFHSHQFTIENVKFWWNGSFRLNRSTNPLQFDGCWNFPETGNCASRSELFVIQNLLSL